MNDPVQGVLVAVSEQRNRLLGFADAVGIVVAFTALAIWPALTDGVNHPKMLALTLGSIAILPFAIRRQIRCWRDAPGLTGQRAVLAAAVLLPLWAIVSAVASDATWQDSVFGTWGRNVGLLTLISVAALLLAAATFSRTDIERFVTWMIVVAVIEVFISGLQILGMSPVPGRAGTGVVIGTLGNPNFAAGFFAIIACLIASRALARGVTVFQRWLSIGLVVALGGLMIETNATQAIAAGLAGVAVFFVAFAFAYRGRFRRIGLVGAGAVTVIGLVGLVASLLGRGPLTRLWTDTGLDFRIEYWKATVNTFEAMPIFGTGPDGLKRFMGQYRPESYVAFLGEENKLDAAHNLLLQIAATIGVVGAFAWLVVMIGSVALLAHRVVRGPVASPVLAAAISGALVAYLVQGLVSIDMLPLIAIGWTLAGIALAYSASDVSSDTPTTDHQSGSRARPHPRSARARSDIDTSRDRIDTSTLIASVTATVLVVASAFLLAQYMRVASQTEGTVTPEFARVALVDPMTTCQARNGIAQAAVASLPAADIIDTIKESTAIDPRCGFMVHFQSELAINTGDLELADASTLQGIEYDPLLPVSWVLRGLLLLQQGDLDGARAALAEAERIAAISPTEGAAEGQVAVLRDQIAARSPEGS